MQKLALIFMTLGMFWVSPVWSATVEGGISTTGAVSGNRVVDEKTNQPISNAKVSLPLLQYQTVTDENGAFKLGAKVEGKTVLSVEKDGYRPFSLTVDEKSSSAPLVVSIQKSNAHDIHLETQMLHLGDNTFSANSANSGDFRLKAMGPFYSKTFTMATAVLNKANYLVIGSIIGIDTAMARSMGQNSVRNSFSSPPQIYFNGNKIAEIHLNGDGQRVKLPNNLIKPNQQNEITIKTGKNMTQTAYVDYDDIEIMNISILAE